MPPTSFRSGSVRVAVPGSYDVRATPARTDRGLPGEPGHDTAVAKDAIVAALGESGLEHVQSVDLTPRVTRDLDGKSPAGRRGTARIEVDLDGEQDAVVLLERDGVYSWHLPVNRADRTRSIDLGPRTARFDIDVRPGSGTTRRATSRPGAGDASSRQDRGLLGDLVKGAAQALVFRFAAPLIVGKAIEKMEEHVRPGLLHLTGTEVSTWVPVETLADLNLPTDRPVRVLLFIHGTFSSTAGGFGAFTYNENAMGLLRTAIEAYDAVIGFDHKTLSVDPRANAKDLLERLSTHHPSAEFVIDIITHSRGGLTTRSFIEYELPGSGWPGVVDRVVFVAATNGGTHLADPARWNDLIDLYTNLAGVGAAALAAVPGAAPIAAVVGGVIKGIGALVKYLVSYAAEKDGVPGLAAMMPEGPFVKDINKAQPGQPGPGTNWFVIGSNFHVELFDDSHHPPEFPRELVARLKEGFVDGLFKAENDLVVDTASMSAIGLPTGGFVSDSREFATNDIIYHSNYFDQLEVLEAICSWLPLGLGAGGGPESEAETSAEPGEDGGAESGPATGGEATNGWGRPADRDLPMSEPPPTAAEAPPVPTAAKLAAEMPATVVEKQDFEVRVLLSRTAIEISDGAVADTADVTVDAARPVSVQVVGKRNAKITGKDSEIFGLPFGGGVSELTFTGQALGTGPVVIHAIVRQGWVPLATLELKAEAVTKAALGILAAPVKVEVHTGIDAPELDGLPCLDIIETSQLDGSVVYRYAIRVEEGGEALNFESAPIHDRATTMNAFLDEVQELVKRDETPAAKLTSLQNIGTRLFDALFPEPMQAYLWKHRDKIGDLIVYADEPYVPWELVHLKPSTGPRQAKPRFLAQGGLVRWRLGGFPPKELRVRRGRARSLVPEYRDPIFVLTEPIHEAAFLADRFGATPVRATPSGVLDVLSQGGFDLLHFSGHGAADSERILEAKILLQGRKRGSKVEAQYLTATDVSENAAWASGEPGPVVVLNACQTGQDGILLTTAGGFADAFLDAGASAFISCLWSVHDQPSRLFVEKLYDELLAGTPMALATARARQEARSRGDETWLAFVVYARPDAVLVTT